MSALLLSLATFFLTLIGGLFGLRYRNHRNLIMGFTTGVLVGLVSFDLLPEIFRFVYALHLDSTGPMLALMGGFLLFHIVEKSILIHFSHEEHYAVHQHPLVGILSAVALTGHSFLDGVGIGLGFQVSTAVGVVVAIAVISHDFSDGLNTVTLMLVNKNTSRRSFLLLLPALHWSKRYLAAGAQQQEYLSHPRPHRAGGRFRLCRHALRLINEEAAAIYSVHPFFTPQPTLLFMLRVYAMQRLRLSSAIAAPTEQWQEAAPLD